MESVRTAPYRKNLVDEIRSYTLGKHDNRRHPGPDRRISANLHGAAQACQVRCWWANAFLSARASRLHLSVALARGRRRHLVVSTGSGIAGRDGARLGDHAHNGHITYKRAGVSSVPVSGPHPLDVPSAGLPKDLGPIVRPAGWSDADVQDVRGTGPNRATACRRATGIGRPRSRRLSLCTPDSRTRCRGGCWG